MTIREILIANTKDQSRYKAVTDASTLGQLKTVLTNPTLYEVYKQDGNDWVRHTQPINIEGMDFSEGITHVSYMNDDSLLPELVPFKGRTVSPIFLLTNTRKQIPSGMDRKEAYQKVKELNLQNTISEGEQMNWTRVKTDVLESYIASAVAGMEEPEGMPESLEEPEKKENTELPCVKTAPHAATVEWLYTGIKSMVRENLLYDKDVIVLADLTSELAKKMIEEKPQITNDDIDNMLASL